VPALPQRPNASSTPKPTCSRRVDASYAIAATTTTQPPSDPWREAGRRRKRAGPGDLSRARHRCAGAPTGWTALRVRQSWGRSVMAGRAHDGPGRYAPRNRPSRGSSVGSQDSRPAAAADPVCSSESRLDTSRPCFVRQASEDATPPAGPGEDLSFWADQHPRTRGSSAPRGVPQRRLCPWRQPRSRPGTRAQTLGRASISKRLPRGA
jgi:hypothetical protein